jgi:hypothetical protein
MTVVRGVDRVVKAHAPRGRASPVSVNGLPGMIVTIDAKPTTIMAFTVVDGRVEIAGTPILTGVAGLSPPPPTLIAAARRLSRLRREDQRLWCVPDFARGWYPV